MKNNCAVIEDLLVPYMDETCSVETKNIVEEHIKDCENCKNKLESFKTELVTDNKEENIKAKKPFKNIKKRFTVLFTVIAVLLVIITPPSVYLIYAANTSFYEADRAFLGLNDDDFLYANQEVVEMHSRRMYCNAYYNLQDRLGKADENATLEELINERLLLDEVEFDYDNAELSEYEGYIYVNIPLIQKIENEKYFVELMYNAVGLGVYNLNYIAVFAENYADANFVSLDYLSGMFENMDTWPYICNIQGCNIYPWTKGVKGTYSMSKFQLSEFRDTGLTLPEGKYEIISNSQSLRKTIEIYDNKKISVETHNKTIEDGHVAIGVVHDTSKPRTYFIAEKPNGDKCLVIRSGKRGISLFSDITINNDGSFSFSNYDFVE